MGLDIPKSTQERLKNAIEFFEFEPVGDDLRLVSSSEITEKEDGSLEFDLNLVENIDHPNASKLKIRFYYDPNTNSLTHHPLPDELAGFEDDLRELIDEIKAEM